MNIGAKVRIRCLEDQFNGREGELADIDDDMGNMCHVVRMEDDAAGDGGHIYVLFAEDELEVIG